MHIQRAKDVPIREGLSWETTWSAPDAGLIRSWERGREMAQQQPELAAKALAGELPILPWRGGVEAAIKSEQKYGVLQYLAMWQGLRGDDLHIDTSLEHHFSFKEPGVTETYTGDREKYSVE